MTKQLCHGTCEKCGAECLHAAEIAQLRARIEQLQQQSTTRLKVFHAIVTQFDISAKQAAKTGFERHGPILHECTLNAFATDDERVHGRAEMLEQEGYGWVRVVEIYVDIPEGQS